MNDSGASWAENCQNVSRSEFPVAMELQFHSPTVLTHLFNYSLMRDPFLPISKTKRNGGISLLNCIRIPREIPDKIKNCSYLTPNIFLHLTSPSRTTSIGRHFHSIQSSFFSDFTFVFSLNFTSKTKRNSNDPNQEPHLTLFNP